MKVSKNELLASLKKAFEALGFQPGDYYDAADMVVWLETHGFYGFDRLLVISKNLTKITDQRCALKHGIAYPQTRARIKFTDPKKRQFTT